MRSKTAVRSTLLAGLKRDFLLRQSGLREESPRKKNRKSWPQIGKDDVAAVLDVLKSGEISLLSEDGVIETMRRAFRKYFGVRFAVPQNNGTSVLHAAYFGLGIRPGDEVIVPSLTFHSSATMIAAVGARPVFCEVDPKTLTLCPRDLEKRITARTRAVCVVHLYGVPADMERISAVCSRHGLPIVEDCSQAHGAAVSGKLAGTIGQAGCLSLQKQKGIAAGEGGILLTNDAAIYDRALLLGHFGLAAKKGVTGKYKDMALTGVGYKYRIHPLAAALAVSQLKKFPAKLKKVRRYCTLLENAMERIDGVTVIKPGVQASRGAYQLGCVLSVAPLGRASRRQRKRFFSNVSAAGIGVHEPFPMLHLDRRFRDNVDFRRPPPYPASRDYKRGDLPVTEAIHPSLVVVEQHVGHIDGVAALVRDVLKREISKL